MLTSEAEAKAQMSRNKIQSTREASKAPHFPMAPMSGEMSRQKGSMCDPKQDRRNKADEGMKHHASGNTKAYKE